MALDNNVPLLLTQSFLDLRDECYSLLDEVVTCIFVNLPVRDLRITIVYQKTRQYAPTPNYSPNSAYYLKNWRGGLKEFVKWLSKDGWPMLVVQNLT